MIDFDSDIDIAWSMWKDLSFSAVDDAVPKSQWKNLKCKSGFQGQLSA